MKKANIFIAVENSVLLAENKRLATARRAIAPASAGKFLFSHSNHNSQRNHNLALAGRVFKTIQN
ncbi:MAG: hypothetical protein LBU34_06545 [Planctomycetaceae bacterium]|nr:hypothetical protein [Planctomycetaceae bacterium]